MMNSTQPSIDLALAMKSPIFKPRPGWGGRLKRQSEKLMNSNRFSVALALAAFVLSFYSVRAYAAQEAANEFIIETAITQPRGAAEDSAFIEIEPKAGQGPGKLAETALDRYLASNSTVIVSKLQRAYMVGYLARRIATVRIKEDELLLIDLGLFVEAEAKAKTIYK